MKSKVKKVLTLLSSGSPRQIWNAALSRVERRLGRDKPISYPVRLDIVLTKACNLRCIFCVSNSTLKAERWLPFDMYERVTAKLFPYARSVFFCSGGEPFLYHRIREALQIAHRYRLETRVVTNGMLLSEEVSKWLVDEQSLTTYQLSFDGATKETVQRLRKGADYGRIVENVSRLAMMRDQAGARCPEIGIRYAVMRSNIEELPDLFELSEAMGFRSVDVNYLNVANDINDDESLFFHQELAAEVFDRARQKAEDFGIRLSLPPIPREDVGDRSCNRPWEFVQVDTDGAIRHCYKAWVQSLGFFDEGFDRIWRGQHYAKIRQTIDSATPYFPYCAFCSLRKGLSHEGAHNQHMHHDAYIIPGLERYQAEFNDRGEENQAAFTERTSKK